MSDRMTAYDVNFLMHVNELGIIPFCSTKEEFMQAMDSLSGPEKRAIKRKFRKLWRNFLKKQNTSDWEKSRLKSSSGRPDKQRRSYRQAKVLDRARRDVRKQLEDKRRNG